MATPELNPENTKKKPNAMQVLLPVTLILATAITALLFIKSRGAHDHSNDSGGQQLQIGSILEDIELHTLGGEVRKLSTLKAKVVLINFWATWCGPCIQEMPSLDSLYRQYKSQGLEVVTISVDDQPEVRVPKFYEKLNLTFDKYIDKNGSLSEKLKIEGLPFTLIVDSNRKILFSQLGDENWFSTSTKKKVEKWLNGGGA